MLSLAGTAGTTCDPNVNDVLLRIELACGILVSLWLVRLCGCTCV